MKTLLLSCYLLLLLLPALPAAAQKENNVWAFSRGLGLDFNSGSPVLITTSIDALESCASACDATGTLLFYSNGLEVFDSRHMVMPNGSGMSGSAASSATQGVAISPVPGERGKYFLFTLDQIEPPGGSGELHYSLIDMSLNGGKGDVVAGFKNRLLGKDMGEKMTLATSCSMTWLITHDMDKPVFYAWPLTSSAVTPVAVTSTTPGITDTRYIIGEMKMSTDYRNLYMVNMAGFLERFSFDLHTGKVAGYQAIDSTHSVYSLELSADNQKLYVADFNDGLAQYDLSLLPDINAVRASKNTLTKGYYISLRRGPDKKIYVNRGTPGKISRINSPERYGAACDLELDVPSLSHTSDYKFVQFGNSTVPFNGFPSKQVISSNDTILCHGKSTPFSVAEPCEKMVWNDGSTARERVLDKVGTYWRRYLKDCILYVDTIVVQAMRRPDTVGRKVLDTVVCFQPQLEVKSRIPSNEYTWSDGSSGQAAMFHDPGLRWVYAMNLEKECEMEVDTFSVKFTDFKLSLPDTFICRGQEISLDAAITDAIAYRWNDGSDQRRLSLNQAGNYWVSVTVGRCSKTDTVRVRSHAFDLSLGPDQEVCDGRKVVLDPGINGGSYTWQDGSTNPQFTVSDSGLYKVTVSRGGCQESTAVHVSYKYCVECMHVPNMFTPNGDGTNDVFRVLPRCQVLKYELVILNRYGEAVFTSKVPTDSWDGSFRGQPLEPGVYYYLVRASFDRGNDVREEMFKGDISLLR